MATKNTRIFHGGRFKATAAKTSKNAALEAKEELQEKGKAVRITHETLGKGKVKLFRVWTK